MIMVSGRCFNCSKRVSILAINCSYCNEDFCIKCRSQEEHRCPCLNDKIRDKKEQLEQLLNKGRERSKSEKFGL